MSTLMTDKHVEEYEKRASTEKFEKVAGYLQENLGQKLTAYLAGLNDPKVVGLWSQGKARPRDMAMFRMRCAYRIALMLVATYGSETAKSWFFGTNTRLDDEAPAYLLRHGKNSEDFRLIVPAAKAFVLSPA